MITKFYPIGFPSVLFNPKRALFALEKPGESRNVPAGNEGLPVDIEKPSQNPLDNHELFEAKNYRKDYARTSFMENPDDKASWRFLSFKHQMEYRALPEAQRETYLNQHGSEIRAGYLADKDFYENRVDPALKVPRLRPSLTDQPELLAQSALYVLGGKVSRAIAENFRGGKPEYIPGNDPESLLKNFDEQVIKRAGAEALKDATAVITFDPDLFGSQIPHEKYVSDTAALLKRLQGLGMRVTMLSPLKTWNFAFRDVPADRNVPVPPGWSKDQIMARQRRNDYWSELARFKQQGLITSLVDLGDAMQANDTMGTNRVFIDADPGKLLNAQGALMAVNGAILGINTAQGYDSGSLQNERYWPGGEDYELGRQTVTGKPVEAKPAGAPLVEESKRREALERIAPKHVLDPLRRLDKDLMGQELVTMDIDDLYKAYKDENKRFIPGMFVYTYPAKRVVHEAFTALQKEKQQGNAGIADLTREFTKLASSVYVKLARVAIIHARELFEDKSGQYLANRKEAFDHAWRYLVNTVKANNFYGFHNENIGKLKKDWSDFMDNKDVSDWLNERGYPKMGFQIQ